MITLTLIVMKKRYINILTLGLAVLFMLVSCEPQQMDKIDIGEAPDPSGVDFTVSPGEDDFHFVLTNTSTSTGIATWDFGNGVKATGQSVIANYPLADTYTVTLTLFTKGGSASASKDVVQTETNYALFTEPNYVNISGGSDDLDGKTWVLDSLSKGHLGVGPADSPNGLDWWNADPLQKTGTGMYDDEINFNINGFLATYINNGISYVKDYRKDDPNYRNPVINDTDYMVEYDTPVEGSWTFMEEDGETYLVLTSGKPLFPIFDVGAEGGKYHVLNLEENEMELTAIGGGIKWHYLLIPKGYVRPSLDFTLNTTEDIASENTYDISISDLNVPDGYTLSNITWDFGEGTTLETTDPAHVESVTYMRKGAYQVSVTVEAGDLTLTKSSQLDIADNHSAYVPYLLDEMVTYTDFGETQLAQLGIDGGSSTFNIVTNPDNSIYPNRSASVGFFEKSYAEWDNVFLLLPTGYRFDIASQNTFKLLVYGTAGDEVLLKLENTDMGGNAWQTGAELRYTIQESNKWEVATYNFVGVDAGQTWIEGQWTDDVTADPRYNTNYYNVVRIMINPGNNSDVFSVYIDDLAGPHVEGLK